MDTFLGPDPFFLLNSTLNKIHSWSGSEQNPMKRMFATRLSEIACAVLEVSILAFKTLGIGIASLKLLAFIPYAKWKKNSLQPSLSAIGSEAIEIGKHAFGLASTIFFGIFFSPEVNFKIHLKLRLAVDESAKKSKEELEKKLEAEQQKAEMAKLRIEQTFEEAQQAKEAEMEMQAIQSRLAELLC